MRRTRHLLRIYWIEALRLWLLLLWVDLRLWGQSWSRQRAWILEEKPVVSETEHGESSAREPSAREVQKLTLWSHLLLHLRFWRVRQKIPCLALALVLRDRAKSSGMNPHLVLGARRESTGQFAAHAWLVWGSFRLDPLATSSLFTAFQEIELSRDRS